MRKSGKQSMAKIDPYVIPQRYKRRIRHINNADLSNHEYPNHRWITEGELVCKTTGIVAAKATARCPKDNTPSKSIGFRVCAGKLNAQIFRRNFYT